MAQTIYRDVSLLAPAMEAIANEFIARCNRASLDIIVVETIRTAERQAWLYASGRTRPGLVVTNAPSVWDSWHGYGLAFDACSKSRGWGVPDEFWRDCCTIARPLGLDCGFDWHMRDRDHFQFGKCKIRPSHLSREAYARGGLVAVWDACGALM